MSVPKKDGAPSRGALTADFLRGDAAAADYVAAVQPRAGRYHGFNLLVSDGAELWSFSNVEGDPVRLGPGVRGLSNHLLETPWPKVTAARARLEAALGAADGAEDLERRLLRPPRGPDDRAGRRSPRDRVAAGLGARPLGRVRRAPRLRDADLDGPRRRDGRRGRGSPSARFGEGGTPLGEVREAFEVRATPRA